MKSEHRHQLAENDLEHRLGELAEKIKPYGKHILFGTLAVSVIAVVVVILVRNAGAASSHAWADYIDCENANQFREVAEQYAGTTVAHWANVNAGEMWLATGVELMFSQRSAAIDDLEKAEAAFNEVLHDSSASPEVRERALNGLARTLEAMSDGDTQPAIDAYNQLITSFPDSRHRKWAEDRIAALESESVQEFYAWFHEQNPSPADRPLPQDDPHAGLPEFTPFLDTTVAPPGLDNGVEPSETEVPMTGETEEGAEGTETTEGEGTSDPGTGPSLGTPMDDASPESPEATTDESATSDDAAPSDDSPAPEPEASDGDAASGEETPAGDAPSTEAATGESDTAETDDPS